MTPSLPVGTPGPDEKFYLPPRLLSVVQGVGRGLPTRRLAAELGTTEGTIKIYISEIYRKTRISCLKASINQRVVLMQMYQRGQIHLTTPERRLEERRARNVLRQQTDRERGKTLERLARESHLPPLPRPLKVLSPKEQEEAARWERIFNEKFADPNYYNQRPVVKIGCPLTDI